MYNVFGYFKLEKQGKNLENSHKRKEDTVYDFDDWINQAVISPASFPSKKGSYVKK